MRLAAVVVLLVCLAPLAAVPVADHPGDALFDLLGTGWCMGTLGPALLAAYLAVRLRGRYVIVYRAKGGRRTRVRFRITSKPLRREFDAKLQAYREAARRFAGGPAADAPADAAVDRRGKWAFAALAGLSVLLAGVFATFGIVLVLSGPERFGWSAGGVPGGQFGPGGATLPPPAVRRPAEVAPLPRAVPRPEVAPAPRPAEGGRR
jgi:hypothetical protein